MIEKTHGDLEYASFQHMCPQSWIGSGPFVKTSRRQYKMGQKQKIQYGAKAEEHAEADAEKTSVPHDESTHGGGRRRRPPPCGEGRPKAAPLHVVRYSFQYLPPHIVSALAPYCIFCFGPIFYCISGPAGAKHQCFFSFLVYL